MNPIQLVQLVSTRVRKLRLRHGLTQEEAAELTGVSMRYFQMIEAGRKKQIFLGTVEALAGAFGLESWQLIGPELPAQSKPRFNVVKSSIHNRRRRKGPYQKRQASGGTPDAARRTRALPEPR